MVKIFRISILSLILVLSSIISSNANASNKLMKEGENFENHSVIGNDEEYKIVKELVNKRTPKEKHYLLKNGNYTAEIFSSDIHYQNENGDFLDIETNLVDEIDSLQKGNSVSKDVSSKIRDIEKQNLSMKSSNMESLRKQSSYIALKLPYAVELPKKFSNGYSIMKNKQSIKLIPLMASSNSIAIQNKIDKNKLYYKDVWLNTDVELITTNDGLKERIILKNEKAPNKISFEVIGNLDTNLSNGELGFLPTSLEDKNGNKKEVSITRKIENQRTYIELH